MAHSHDCRLLSVDRNILFWLLTRIMTTTGVYKYIEMCIKNRVFNQIHIVFWPALTRSFVYSFIFSSPFSPSAMQSFTFQFRLFIWMCHPCRSSTSIRQEINLIKATQSHRQIVCIFKRIQWLRARATCRIHHPLYIKYNSKTINLYRCV